MIWFVHMRKCGIAEDFGQCSVRWFCCASVVKKDFAKRWRKIIVYASRFPPRPLRAQFFEAGGFEQKCSKAQNSQNIREAIWGSWVWIECSKAQNSRKFSEKLFEASCFFVVVIFCFEKSEACVFGFSENTHYPALESGNLQCNVESNCLHIWVQIRPSIWRFPVSKNEACFCFLKKTIPSLRIWQFTVQCLCKLLTYLSATQP